MLVGSTWHKLWRGVTSSLSITINFPVEKRLLDRGYAFRYRHRIVRAGQRHMDFILNGESIYSGIPPGGVNVYNLPSDKLVDGMNTLQLKPTNGAATEGKDLSHTANGVEFIAKEGDASAWIRAASGQGDSYTYTVGTSPAKVRLTWNALPSGTVLIVR